MGSSTPDELRAARAVLIARRARWLLVSSSADRRGRDNGLDRLEPDEPANFFYIVVGSLRSGRQLGGVIVSVSPPSLTVAPTASSSRTTEE